MLPKRPSHTDESVEKDAGFGPSHGYPQSHGGPTGPGDAPAKPTPAKRKQSRKSKRAAGVALNLDRRVSHRAKNAKKVGRTFDAATNETKGGRHVD